MKPALLLIDLQQDYLNLPNLLPSTPSVIQQAKSLLEGCRRLGLPVFHGWTTVRKENDQRMDHWKKAGKWICLEHTEGHKPPNALRPLDDETVIHKTGYSVFADDQLDTKLRTLGCDTLIIAGIHLHACVRSSVLEAYCRGYAVTIADDAVASDDPLHATITRRYLIDRRINFLPVASILEGLAKQRPTLNSQDGAYIHRSPRDTRQVLFEIPEARLPEIREASSKAKHAFDRWRRSTLNQRRELLLEIARVLYQQSQTLIQMLVDHIGKPRTEAEAEVDRSIELLKISAKYGDEIQGQATSAHSRYRYEPLGVVAMITPWNNPVAVPIGKLAPALLYGNAVVWKPAPASAQISSHIAGVLLEAGCPENLVSVVQGDHAAARHLASDSNIDAVTLTGSVNAGHAIMEICARRYVPMQGEFGGNNASIVWADTDIASAAGAIAPAAFGFAGQRCTSNRRVIVDQRCMDSFMDHLLDTSAALKWGDPDDSSTQLGPVITLKKYDDLRSLITRAQESSLKTYVPHQKQSGLPQRSEFGAYFPATIVHCDEPDHEMVQAESFGPILVIQAARNFDHALDLLNNVPHGLVASLFSASPQLRQTFVHQAKAGLLKINEPTTGADAASPFGGWKASGMGPAEHGPSDREFYTRTQTIYEHDEDKRG